jgi:hypothetical protein
MLHGDKSNGEDYMDDSKHDDKNDNLLKNTGDIAIF